MYDDHGNEKTRPRYGNKAKIKSKAVDVKKIATIDSYMINVIVQLQISAHSLEI